MTKGASPLYSDEPEGEKGSPPSPIKGEGPPYHFRGRSLVKKEILNYNVALTFFNVGI